MLVAHVAQHSPRWLDPGYEVARIGLAVRLWTCFPVRALRSDVPGRPLERMRHAPTSRALG